jgi:uncharacterized damage-inducible protein DinB
VTAIDGKTKIREAAMDSSSKTVRDASTETPARLRRMAETCDELPGLIADLSPSQLASRAADGGWSVGWVVCHLRDVEEAYFERVGFILINERPFLSTFDPDRWAAERQYRQQDPHLALECFLSARRATLAALRALAPSEWERGGQHSLRGFMTIRRIVHGWAKHDTEHITQITLVRSNRS